MCRRGRCQDSPAPSQQAPPSNVFNSRAPRLDSLAGGRQNGASGHPFLAHVSRRTPSGRTTSGPSDTRDNNAHPSPQVRCRGRMSWRGRGGVHLFRVFRRPGLAATRPDGNWVLAASRPACHPPILLVSAGKIFAAYGGWSVWSWHGRCPGGCHRPAPSSERHAGCSCHTCRRSFDWGRLVEPFQRSRRRGANRQRRQGQLARWGRLGGSSVCPALCLHQRCSTPKRSVTQSTAGIARHRTSGQAGSEIRHADSLCRLQKRRIKQKIAAPRIAGHPPPVRFLHSRERPCHFFLENS